MIIDQKLDSLQNSKEEETSPIPQIIDVEGKVLNFKNNVHQVKKESSKGPLYQAEDEALEDEEQISPEITKSVEVTIEEVPSPSAPTVVPDSNEDQKEQMQLVPYGQKYHNVSSFSQNQDTSTTISISGEE